MDGREPAAAHPTVPVPRCGLVRAIRVSGILTTSVDAVPLSEITDMSLRCSILGRVLGFGTIQVETAGQDGALDRLEFLPSPVCRAMLTRALSAL